MLLTDRGENDASPRATQTIGGLPSSSPSPSAANEEHCLICFDALAAHFGLTHFGPPPPTSRDDVQCALFVTWNKRASSHAAHLQLRGCIGCLKPLPLASALKDYALTSALHDRRFPPMDVSELSMLQCTVQLLGHFEPCATYDWTIGVHGLTISFSDRGTARSAVYLPDVIPEQGWTQTQALDSLIRKSGCVQRITDELRSSLEVSRFVSTKCSMLYHRWAELRSVAPPSSSRTAPAPSWTREEPEDHLPPPRGDTPHA